MRRSRSLLFFLIVLAVAVSGLLVGAGSSGAAAPSFAAPVALTDGGVDDSSVAWGDYDSDGDLDILLTGYNGSAYVSKIYENDSDSFVEDTVAEAGLADVGDGSVAWGDYDGDGDLDILLTGYSGSEGADISRVYQNDGSGNFSAIGASLIGVERGSAAWGDYDLDGDLDILLTGASGSARVSKIYRNDEGSFVEDTAAGADLPDVADSSAAWGDSDGDGDLDILLSGNASGGDISDVYLNDGDGSFAAAGTGLSTRPVSQGSAAWGDYNADGRLDIVLTGYSGDPGRLWRNSGSNTFSNFGSFTNVYESSVAWGDQDSDGDLDFLATGYTYSSSPNGKIYTYDGGGLYEYGAGLTGVRNSAVAWGDYNSDGKLDILLTGNDGSNRVGQIYQNQVTTANTAPGAPANPKSSVSNSDVTLSWDAAGDTDQSGGLTYNLRVGTTPGDTDIVSPMALSGGTRLVAQMGNAGEETSHTLELEPGTYYWSVQAIDNNFEGSAFSSEGIFTVGFTDIGASLTGVENASTSWGDYDSDGDLDAPVTGCTAGACFGNRISKIYENDANAGAIRRGHGRRLDVE